ncbi:hypothetical protein [Caldivirga maquilingensis]|uniref:Uncharacterized protein n=1 Tax=Caldivirga maquilingensis (strain ATCC 700844 / DSM 13496 / JCM 10307 / IC-167) TaxID=397948 RepID=A8M9B1_CALMQ|nr:hypothetical protein [Caldivirga maquilingensis]ABW02330.1 hypothetical protein Cmaq_1506 [Caldivirga maquilingensis IC-167]
MLRPGNQTFSEIQTVAKVLVTVIGNPRYTIVFIASFLLLFTAFYYLYTTGHVGYILLRNYYVYYDLASSLVVSLLNSMVMVMGLYGLRLRLSGLSIPSIALGLAPTACCAPTVAALVTSVVASMAGSSTALLTVGKLQGVLGVYNPIFVALSIAIAVVGLNNVAKNLVCSCSR